MLSDDVVSLSFTLVDKGVEVTSKVILSILARAYINKGANKDCIVHGEQTIKNLNAQNLALDSIPIENRDIKKIRKELKEYGLDFAVKQSKIDINKYYIYFKGKDINRVETALKEYIGKEINMDTRKDKSIEDTKKQTINEQIKKVKVEKNEQVKNESVKKTKKLER
ncbi:MAG: PcfB family protein [Oscillospiraceae bacterium]